MILKDYKITVELRDWLIMLGIINMMGILVVWLISLVVAQKVVFVDEERDKCVEAGGRWEVLQSYKDKNEYNYKCFKEQQILWETEY